jgi:CRP-like cAMP-binding protein
MQEAGLPIQHLIFPASGAYSVQTAKGVEVAVVGRTGLLGLDLVLRDPLARFAAVALVDGEVDQIDANAFSHLVRARSGLGPQLLPHVSSFLGQVATTAALAARSTIQQRVAAWVLAVTALTDSDELRITHRQLAACLCVRRAGVTVALHVLEGLHALRSKRHVLTVTDRQALTDMAA